MHMSNVQILMVLILRHLQKQKSRLTDYVRFEFKTRL